MMMLTMGAAGPPPHRQLHPMNPANCRGTDGHRKSWCYTSASPQNRCFGSPPAATAPTLPPTVATEPRSSNAPSRPFAGENGTLLYSWAPTSRVRGIQEWRCSKAPSGVANTAFLVGGVGLPQIQQRLFLVHSCGSPGPSCSWNRTEARPRCQYIVASSFLRGLVAAD